MVDSVAADVNHMVAINVGSTLEIIKLLIHRPNVTLLGALHGLFREVLLKVVLDTPDTAITAPALISFPGKTLQIVKEMKGDSAVLCLANIPSMTSGEASSLPAA